MIAAVRIDGSILVKVGDVLEHADDGVTRPQGDPVVTPRSFARVLDAAPGETAPDGSYRVRCELLVQRPFVPRTERMPA